MNTENIEKVKEELNVKSSDNTYDVIEIIFKLVEYNGGMSRQEFLDPSHNRINVIRRNVTAVLLYTYTGLSHSKVAELINKSRCTVTYACKTHETLLNFDKAYRSLYHKCSMQYMQINSTYKHMDTDISDITSKINEFEKILNELKHFIVMINYSRTKINKDDFDGCFTD